MCKSLQYVICTITCMLDPWLTEIRNVANAVYFLTQCSLYFSTSVTILK